MPEIILFNPSVENVYKGLKGPAFPPIGLVMLASVLKDAGIHVRLLDQSRTDTDDHFLEEKLDDCFLAGISITTPTMKPGLELADQLKRLKPDIRIVMGGVHVTLRPQDVFNGSSVDYAIVGEGEYVLLNLARSLLDDRKPAELPGLWRRLPDGKGKQGPPRQFIKNIDALPTPDFTTLERLDYTYPDALTSPVLPLITSRGCPGKCTYCNSPTLWERRLRMRSAEKVVQDFKLLKEKYSVGEIHIWDDNFITNRKRVRQIVRLIKEENLRLKFAFPNGVRADFLDEEMVTMLKEMGTYSVAVGIESGSQEILDSMNKMITLEKMQEVIFLLKKFEIETWAFFLFGMPNENEETLRKTIDFAVKIDPDVAKFHILKPYPGTQVAAELFERGLITNTNYEEYGVHLPPVHRTAVLLPEHLLEWQKTAYKKFYLRPMKILFEGLRMFRSWHRIKLNLPIAFRILVYKLFGRKL